MNGVFTIVAKNYLPLARTLGDALNKYHPDLKFFIFIADEIAEGEDYKNEKYTIIGSDVLNIKDLSNLAFKYNVTEFCTALKPFAFEYLFSEQGCSKVIYFDPDIFVFNKLDLIFNELDTNFIVLTPHFFTPELNYSGAVPEGGIFFLGMFNLGFVALSNAKDGLFVIEWWKSRLIDKAYADKIDGYHTDQKWMDFIPVFFDKGVCILRKLGYNMAIWNIHERLISQTKDGNLLVNSRLQKGEIDDLVFFHFAGFDPHNLKFIHKYHPAFLLEDFPEIAPLMEMYKKLILENGYESFIKIPYSYSNFENGDYITSFQRRLFRRISEEGITFENPFKTNQGSFFDLLKKNNLLSKNGRQSEKINTRNINQMEGKRLMLNKVMLMVKFILGIDRYSLLLKFAFRFVRPENQVFLIKEVRNKIGFLHEGAFPAKYREVVIKKNQEKDILL